VLVAQNVPRYRLLSSYRAVLADNFYLSAFVAGGAMRIVASLIAQSILILRGLQGAVSPVAILHLTFLGATVGGLGNAAWYRLLDESLGRLGVSARADGTTQARIRDVILKTTLSYCVWAPVCNSAYLLAMPLLRGEPLALALANVRAQFLIVMGLELACFMPYNLFAFRAIPLSLRAPIQSCVACVFSVGLALMA